MKRKIALITGANRGIGFETARQLAEQGIKVLLGARSEEKGKDAESKLKAEGLMSSLFCSMSMMQKRTNRRPQLSKKSSGELDILINNAGIYIDESENGAHVPASKTSLDIFRKTFDTNFFDIISLTQTLFRWSKNRTKAESYFYRAF